MIRLWNGLGWVDTASRRYALPPDGETFSIAPGAPAHGSRLFHVVGLPALVAVIVPAPEAPFYDGERAAIESILIGGLAQVAFILEGREGYAVVEGRGAPFSLATAAASLKVIGGWDETVPIVIKCNDRAIEVRLSHHVGWTAEAREART